MPRLMAPNYTPAELPAESYVDHCDTGNTASPRFPAQPDGRREVYRDDLGYAAHLVVVSCMDCGTELVRYSRMRRLAKPITRLNWRHDADSWRSMGH
jgi:hypothetical protein